MFTSCSYSLLVPFPSHLYDHQEGGAIMTQVALVGGVSLQSSPAPVQGAPAPHAASQQGAAAKNGKEEAADEYSPFGAAFGIPAYGLQAASTVLNCLTSFSAGEVGRLTRLAPGLGGFGDGFGSMRGTGSFLEHFAPGTPLASLAPVVTGMAVGVGLLKSVYELQIASETGSKQQMTDGLLDLALTVSSFLTFLPPLTGVGVVTTPLLMGAKLLYDVAKGDEGKENSSAGGQHPSPQPSPPASQPGTKVA